MTSPTPLPDWKSVGKEGTWTITDHHGDSLTVTGALLGIGSSYRPRHQNHPGADYAPPRTHCSTCRWTEIYIFAVDKSEGEEAQGRYLIVKRGASVIPGEKDLIEWGWQITGYEVLNSLTTRRGTEAFLTAPSSRALSQAAEFDPGVNEAWTSRAVR